MASKKKKKQARRRFKVSFWIDVPEDTDEFVTEELVTALGVTEPRTKAPTVQTIDASELAAACGFALDPLACPKCGGCGWFATIGPDRPCECNPHRLSVEACLADLDRRKNERNQQTAERIRKATR